MLKNHILFPGTIIVGLSVHVQYVLLVWIVIATVTKVVEGCVYLRRRYYAVGALGRRVRALRSPLSAALLSPLPVL